MKRSESGILTPFEKFAWDNSKGKLVIKLSLKAIESPLPLYIEFGKNSERLCLGEEKAVRKIADESDCISKYKGALLMISEERLYFRDALAAAHRSLLIPHGGNTITNVFDCRTRTTSCVASTSWNRTPSKNSVNRNNTATTTSVMVSCSIKRVQSYRGSTLRSLKNSKELAWHNKKLKSKDSPTRRQSINRWIEKISDEWKTLESKF